MSLLDVTLAAGYREWMERAYCRTVDNPDLWHGDNGIEDTTEAKRLCRTACPVANECLKFALDHDEREGVWGGMSAQDRMKLVYGNRRKSCERNHPTEPSELRTRPDGLTRCRACERATYRRRTAA